MLVPPLLRSLTISVAGIIGIGAPLVINPYLYTQLVVTPDSARSGLLPAHQLRGAPARQLQGGCDASDSTYQVNYGCDASLSIGTLSFSIAGECSCRLAQCCAACMAPPRQLVPRRLQAIRLTCGTARSWAVPAFLDPTLSTVKRVLVACRRLSQ